MEGIEHCVYYLTIVVIIVAVVFFVNKYKQLRKKCQEHERKQLEHRRGASSNGNIEYGELNDHYFGQKVNEEIIQRKFLVFVPNVNFSTIKYKMPVLFLFHGTNSSALNNSYLYQYASGNSNGWRELAYKKKFLLVLLESTNWSYPSKDSMSIPVPESGWLPGNVDLEYVKRVVNIVEEHYPVDKNLYFAHGHSNGGLFISDLVMKLPIFRAVCNHMGGITLKKFRKILPDSKISFKSAETKTPILLVTALYDCNRRYCLEAKRLYTKYQWDLTYFEYSDKRLHGNYLESVALFDDFITPFLDQYLKELPEHLKYDEIVRSFI